MKRKINGKIIIEEQEKETIKLIYSGNELKEKTWLTVEATRKLIFNRDPDIVWKESLKHLGGDYEMMINFPIDPQLN